MGYQYKIIVSSHGLYKEFEIPMDMERVKLGTTSGCDFRLNPDFFFENIEIELRKTEKWFVKSADNLYISRGDILKLFSTELYHGDSLNICYAESGEKALELRFMIDFEAENTKYDKKINLTGKDYITISDKPNADIVLTSQYGINTDIRLKKSSKGWIVEEKHSQYGVYINGKKIEKDVLINDFEFVSIADWIFYYKNNEIYFSDDNITVNKISVENLSEHINDNYPMFVRNTRIKSKIEDEPIKILDPDSIPKKPELNLVTSLMPTLVMFVLVVIFRGIMNTSGGTYVIFTICSMGMGVITTILNLVNTQKKYKKECKEREETYNNYIQRKREEIEKARQEELDSLRNTYYSTEKCLHHIEIFSPNLFDRVPEDEDFLDVYLGEGEVKAKKKIDYKEQEKLETGDELSHIPKKISDEYEYIKNAPVAVKLKDANAVGVIGDKKNLYQILKCFVVDIISRQYYGDVSLYAFLDTDIENYKWIEMIPHIKGNGFCRNIVCDNESKNNVFEHLYKDLTIRSESKNITGYNVILIMNEQGIKSHPISKFIEHAANLKTVFVFFEEKEEYLPLHCSRIVKIESDNCGELFESSNKMENKKFEYINISDDRLAHAIEILAPVYCEEISLENSLRKNISLFELLGIYSVEDIDLKERWAKSRIYESMAAPLGVNAKDGIVYLNLHEKAHGPHGLVAGTTGSGKSEILQAFILSAATLFHPYEIGFVIIDFKGGGMVNQFKELPHLIGAITNIDGNEVQRSLKSIKAELLKRQNNFAMAGVNHIDKYIQLYKEGKVSEALPHLVIIVDEFAELKAEQPEFMKELISTARIGRSLGVHLILATQKPSGVVDAQIWSNSKFKLCLKVQSKEDSNEVIKTPLAAEIKEPGRAYLQVGNNEVFELFQSAYSGAPAAVDASEIDKEFVINQVSFAGFKKPIFVNKKQKKKTSNNKNQLEAIVQYIDKFCDDNGIKKLSNICLPPLPELLPYTKGKKIESENIFVNLGIIDDPAHQAQNEMILDITSKNYMILGSAQTGKTNILQTIIRNLAENYTPEEVNIFVIDFGSMILRNFSHLNHVGGVVCSFEDEKLKSLFRLLNEEVAYRKNKLAELGVSSFASYKEAGKKDLPQIVVLIDNITALKELYLSEEDLLLPLCRDGNTVGITFVVANAQSAGIGYKYLNYFEGRMALFCNETSEYSMLFEGNRLRIPNIPGRALVQVDKAVYESQTYISFKGEKEYERVMAIQEFVKMCNSQNSGMKAKGIPEIPKNLNVEYVKQNFPDANKNNQIMIGMDYTFITPVFADIMSTPMLSLSGKKENGKELFAKYFVDTMINGDMGDTELYILDDFNAKWSEYEFLPETAYYTDTREGSVSIITEIGQRISERYERFVNRSIDINNEPWILLVVESNDAIADISANKNAVAMVKDFIGKYSGMKVMLLFTNIPNATIPFGAPELMKLIKDNKKYLIFEDIGNIKLCDVSLSLTRKYAKAIETSDAYYINDNELKKVRTVKQ